MARSIIHLGIDSFFSSVEIVDHPGFRFKPVAVAVEQGKARKLCCVSATARKHQIARDMKVEDALQRCPQLVVVNARYKRYKDVSDRIRKLCLEYTNLVEPAGLAETFLDVTRNKRDIRHAPRIAGELKLKVKRHFNLSATAGIGPNKLLSRLASALEGPGGFGVVNENSVAGFLRPISIRQVWGIGHIAVQALEELGIETLGDLSRASRKDLTRKFGKAAASYMRLAQGEDDQPVMPNREPKSLSHELTYPEPRTSLPALKGSLKDLSLALEDTLWKRNLLALTISLKIKHSGSGVIRRSATLLSPVNDAKSICSAAEALLMKTRGGKDPVERLGIMATNLLPEGGPYQMSLF